MNMESKRKKGILFGALALALAVICVAVVWNGMQPKEKVSKLTEEQISELREQYPLCVDKAPPLVDAVSLSLEQVKASVDSFVYAEVVGDVSYYTVSASTGNEQLDEKRRANGINDEFQFYEYTLSVLGDTNGKYKKGEKITIASNVMFMDYKPKLSEGMRMVIPVSRDPEKPSRSYYQLDGIYYITEDGYAISAFEEKLEPEPLSGMKVEELMQELKK